MVTCTTPPFRAAVRLNSGVRPQQLTFVTTGGSEMGFIAIDCMKCGANLEVDETATTYTCKYCRTVHERDYSNSATPTPNSYGVMAKRAIANSEFGKALQFIEQGLVIDPHNDNLLRLENEAKAGLATLVDGHTALAQEELNAIQKESEAEQYKLQAEFILHELQANIQVYGSNSVLQGATPANVDLAISPKQEPPTNFDQLPPNT